MVKSIASLPSPIGQGHSKQVSKESEDFLSQLEFEHEMF